MYNILGTICFLVAVSYVSSTPISSKSSSKVDFDFLLLAQFWPMSSCIYFEERGEKCDVPKYIKGWTIHGLWPSTHTGAQPEFCNSSMKFDFSLIKSLQPMLDTNWHYYDADAEPTGLWSHEWEKHGTCAFSLPLLQGELNYFQTTLMVHSKLNTSGALSASQIVPSETQTYKREDFFNALVKFYTFKPNVICDYDKTTHKTYIDQIYLCFDKTLKQMDCPLVESSKSYYQDCEEQDEIYYLPHNNMPENYGSNTLYFEPEKKGF